VTKTKTASMAGINHRANFEDAISSATNKFRDVI
jgi:hypothetical protein